MRAPRVLTYGAAHDADFVVSVSGSNTRGGVDFAVSRTGRPWGAYSTSIPGVHNALNGTAALVVADLMGVDRREAALALERFAGVQRRFQILFRAW